MGSLTFLAMVLGGGGWVFVLLADALSVQGLYARGYGTPQDILIFIGIPLLGLIASIPLSGLLYQRGRKRSALTIAVLSFLAFIGAWLVMMFAAAGA